MAAVIPMRQGNPSESKALRRMDALRAIFTLLLASSAAGQTTGARPAFEAAVIKAPSINDESSWSLQAAGELMLRNVTVYDLIVAALYKPGWLPPEGGAEWIQSMRVDLVAKAPAKTSFEGVRPMVLDLLEERFHFAYHRETQIRSAYGLVAVHGGPKVGEPDPDDYRGCDSERVEGQRWREKCKHMSLTVLCEQLPNMDSHDIDKPVINLTGLEGQYDFNLEWDRRPRNSPSDAAGEPRTTLIDALAYLGLKLESRKLPIEITVIDRVERPSLDQ